ncbi:NACHT domain-containing protein [Pseudomonas sp. UBA2684]|uniref:NACHT domain-containing protein n=1 Tax=Pseudomonas sp. UBA2684 TaxID=1947311 RepID=UPI0025F950E6|nr:hypothetical protein [Pseudomonas sp. UBA2684]|tara:strand:+ start:234 stop:2015 length:1782 start_codon:yes stop_codon:yes gene_type:complete
MPDFSAAIALLKKPIEDVYSVAKDEVKSKIALVRTSAKMKQLHKKLYETQRVKTIWHTERPCSLSSFFHPVSIVTDNASVIGPFRLNGLDAFDNNHNIIFGTVGQGKSILLRYLLGKEIKSGARIPVFVELRNVGAGTILDALKEKFSSVLGIPVDEQVFSSFAQDGKVSFLLDGFDEVDPSNVTRVLSEIEDLSYRYQDCKMVLTSRPDSECRHLTNFYSNKIQPLESDSLLGFYKKITKDNEFSLRLNSAVKGSPTKIRELVTTPLLATLLAISYRSAQKIPLDFAEFYDDLFQILLIRHDASKLGWRRNRKSKLDDRQVQQIFEAFCFSTRRRQITTIDKEVAYSIAQESIAETSIEAEPQNFLDDIKKITCLLVDEGKKYHFVHASVQEFFAARYIKTKADVVAHRFYEQLVSGKWSSWSEELGFLRQIDAHRALKYFYIPDLNSTIDHLLKDKSEPDSGVVSDYLGSMRVVKKISVRDGKAAVSYYVDKDLSYNCYYMNVLATRLFSSMFSRHVDVHNVLGWSIGFENDPSCMVRTYLEIANDRGKVFTAEIFSKVDAIVRDFLRERNVMQNSVQREENKTSFIDLSV